MNDFRCDTCGKFMNPGEAGSSKAFVYDTHYTYEECNFVCAKCTKEKGVAQSHQCVEAFVTVEPSEE